MRATGYGMKHMKGIDTMMGRHGSGEKRQERRDRREETGEKRQETEVLLGILDYGGVLLIEIRDNKE